jgi:ArsR family transcriptional regulator
MRNYSSFFAALADENRLRLLHLIRGGEICVCYLQGVLQTNQPKISRHLAYLKKAGLVEARREGKWMHYRLKVVEGALEAILSEILARSQKDPQIKKDAGRLKQVCCCPARYGIAPVGKNSDHNDC